MDKNITDKYLGIPFKADGRDFDGVYCYGLCQLIYETEFGIILPEINKIGDLCEKIDHPEKFCFVTFSEPGSQMETHLGLMINDHQFIHISDNVKRSVPFPVLENINDRLWKMRRKGFYRLKKDAELNRI